MNVEYQIIALCVASAINSVVIFIVAKGLERSISASETIIAVKVRADIQDWLVSMGGIGLQTKLGMVRPDECTHAWEDWPQGNEHCVKCGMVRQVP